jgi:hypothetical protein
MSSALEHQIAAAFQAPRRTVPHSCIVCRIAATYRPNRRSRGVVVAVKSETRNPVRLGMHVRETLTHCERNIPVVTNLIFEGCRVWPREIMISKMKGSAGKNK